MESTSVSAPSIVKLLENAVTFAMRVYSGEANTSLSTALESTSKDLDPTPTSEISQDTLDSVDRANASTAAFEETDDIQHSDEAISILQSFLDRTSENDPHRHYLLFNLALTLCRRVEIQLSKKSLESLLDLHLTLTRSLFLLRQAVTVSPATLDVKIQYLGQFGHIATLWSTLLSSRWPDHDVLALVAQLKADRDATGDPNAERITGFLSEVIFASTLSTAFGATQNPLYRTEGREVYRRTLKSMREVLPLDAIVEPVGSMDIFQKLRVLSFVTQGVIPFIVQLAALTMQKLVEVPLSAVVGRRLASLAMGKGLQQQGVEWLEQCLMLVWGQTNLRAPPPLDATRVQGVQAEPGPEDKTGQVVLAFLGICLYVDVVADGRASVAHPEQIAYFLIEEWLKLRRELYSKPNFQDPFKSQSFHHIVNAARTAPVVMLNLWDDQCDALLLPGEGKFKCIRLPGVTEDFAAKLQANFRNGLASDHFRSRGDEIPDEHRGVRFPQTLSTIRRVLAAVWNEVVKPILDEMKLEPVENPALDPPRLTWCPTGPTSFFPLHAAGLYDSQERGTKAYEYVASSYTPTLSILADANVALSREPEPFQGILAVSQPNADGQAPIPKTVDEIKAFIKAVDGTVAVKWLNGAEATKEAVLSGMQSSTWVHLACHARQYPLNTSESAFMLANAETLSLADISERASANGELAFLSACQTAAGDFDLSEEGVHLAAGMLVAGYRSVIATTWSVRDEDAPLVAEAVYQRLLDGGQVNRTGTALALHHATRLLREKVGEDQFMRWAPFIHLGI